jgi:hypothetical protein
MLNRKPLRIANQGGHGVSGRQSLFEQRSPDATRGTDDQDIHCTFCSMRPARAGVLISIKERTITAPEK